MADIKFIDLKDTESVEFYIYPDISQSFRTGNVTFNFIDELMNDIYKIVIRLSEKYIWHNEEFQIYPKNLASCFEPTLNGREPFCFYGSLNYGENVEDEWFLVYLVMELTKQIDGLIVQIRDGDGEFLLIEAAEQLPNWITPESSEGKTFIYKGALHVLPLTYKMDNGDFIVTHEVLKYVQENSEKIKCDQSIQKAIEHKISGYPNIIEKTYHNAILYVPVGVASLLNADEKLIAPAIQAFCDRDLIDIKACRAMKYFPPENRVYTNVKFTRLLYVMLATSKYIPDKRIGWNLPTPTDESYKSHLLGIKLACGFEILLNQAKGDSSKGDSEESDFDNDQNWKRFFKSLVARNYFRGLLEHSKQYNQLLDAAKEFYSNSCGKSLKPSRAKQVLDKFSKIDIDLEELKKKEMNLSKSDDDSWMNITQEELDSLLKARFGCTGDKSGDDRFEISHHLDEFINHVSDMEGAEFPKKSKTSKNTALKTRTSKQRKTVKFSPDTKTSEAQSADTVGNSSNINFEPEGFINAIQNILDFSIPDDNYWDSEGSGMSSYEDESEMEIGENEKKSHKKDKVLIRYMKEMDKELSHTTMAKSFVTENDTDIKTGKDNFEQAEEFKPVDIDVNALKNIISSYRAQNGEPGPAENLLGPLGVNLDEIEADVD